ncbi:hypothetical protein [Kamptonema formosum]|uniref:hypothetical protein n=1 Tax=Kamptonema formosum TaxID=331992 RepID=UPI000375DD98|nr:hypothetical protein [Oscillatoria sp. PCC 10802]
MISLIKNAAGKIPNLFQEDTAATASRIFLWGAWAVYVGYLLLSDFAPGESLLHTQPETLREALNLSLNFWFVLPAVFPTSAPALNPALEGLFNLVVTWGLLFWGFLSDGRQQRFPIIAFMIGTAFLTNVFYLPWLALRQPNPHTPKGSLTFLEKIAESRVFPLVLTGAVAASVAWATWARPEFGDLRARWEALLELLSTDRLAHSFFIDIIVFWIFQSWLVADDMARRNWRDATALWTVRLVPLIGLVVYLFRRPSLPAQPSEVNTSR